MLEKVIGRPKTKFMNLEEEVEYLRDQNLLLKSKSKEKGVANEAITI